MPKINIEGAEYDIDTLSDNAKQQLQSLQFVDAELQRLQAQSAVLQTARQAYFNALKQAVVVPTVIPMESGTIKFA